VFGEALRNALMHAAPRELHVRIVLDGAFVLQVVNDGVGDRAARRSAKQADVRGESLHGPREVIRRGARTRTGDLEPEPAQQVHPRLHGSHATPPRHPGPDSTRALLVGARSEGGDTPVRVR